MLLFIRFCCCSLVCFVVRHEFVYANAVVNLLLLFFCCCSLVYVTVH